MSPEPARKIVGVGGEDVFGGMERDEPFQFGTHGLFVESGPVDGNVAVAAVPGEITGSIRREAEHGGPGQADMGHEQGTLRTEPRTVDEDGGMGNRDTHEGAERRVVDLQAEERRNGINDFVSERREGLHERGGGHAARGSQYAVEGSESSVVVVCQEKSLVGLWGDGPDPCVGKHRHIVTVQQTEQQVDHLHGIVRAREDPVVVLGIERYAVALEPGRGFAVSEPVEERAEEVVTARVGVGEVPDVGKGIGEVASAAPGESELVEGMSRRFEDGDGAVGKGLNDMDGGKASRGTGTYDGDVFLHNERK